MCGGVAEGQALFRDTAFETLIVAKARTCARVAFPREEKLEWRVGRPPPLLHRVQADHVAFAIRDQRDESVRADGHLVLDDATA